MLQGEEGTVQWDSLTLEVHYPMIWKIYMLFLLVALFVTLAKLIKLWIAAPPFRLKQKANSSAYLKQLNESRTSLKQWMGCALIGWGIVATQGIRETSERLLQAKATGGTISILFAAYYFSPLLLSGLTVVLLIFLARWYLLARVQRLNQGTTLS